MELATTPCLLCFVMSRCSPVHGELSEKREPKERRKRSRKQELLEVGLGSPGEGARGHKKEGVLSVCLPPHFTQERTWGPEGELQCRGVLTLVRFGAAGFSLQNE